MGKSLSVPILISHATQYTAFYIPLFFPFLYIPYLFPHVSYPPSPHTCQRTHVLGSMQGPNLGKNGIDVIPNSERFAPVPPEHLKSDDSSESLATSITCTNLKPGSAETESRTKDENNEEYPQRKKLLPRETGYDIGMGSPVPLSAEAVQIITRLRNMKVRLTLVAHLSCPLPPDMGKAGDLLCIM